MWPEILKKSIQEIIKGLVRPDSTVSGQDEKRMYDDWLRKNSPPPPNKDADRNGYEPSRQYKDGQYENGGDEYKGLLRPMSQNETDNYGIRKLTDNEIEFNDNSGNLISIKETVIDMCPVLLLGTKDDSGNIIGQDKIIDLGVLPIEFKRFTAADVAPSSLSFSMQLYRLRPAAIPFIPAGWDSRAMSGLGVAVRTGLT